MGKVKIKVVSTDYCYRIDAIGEHGLTVIVENDHGKVLFDTGQGLALKHNLDVLGWNLENLDAIAISHGHNDHTGGLLQALELSGADEIPVYGHEDILLERIKVYPWGEGPTGTPLPRKDYEKAGAKFIFNEEPVELIKGVRLTGPIERGFVETNTTAHFQIIDGQKVQDPFHDDQALIVETDKGLIIVFGCAHAGVINTMNHVEKVTGEKKFYGLLGGTHLLEADDTVLEKTLKEIENREVQILGFTHCTGLDQIAYFNRHFKGKCCDASTGFLLEV
ncbi:MAG: MBL fold metallo-hydrolase [Clostridia bacterium]|nr:MBL fold metallo-hydrolase [Clostridia bacterium]